MNCPGHMLLFGTRCAATASCRCASPRRRRCTATSSAGALHGLTRVRHVTQDDAHIFCTREQIEDEIFGCLDFARTSTTCSGSRRSFELSTRPENKLGTDEEWDFTEGALRAALERRGLEYERERGRRRVLRAEDRPAHDRLARPLVADGHDPARLPDAAALRPPLHGRRQRRAHPVRRSTARCFGSFERFIGILIEHYAGAFPFWLAPVQVRVIPVGEGHREAAHALAAQARRPTASRSTTPTRPSASGSGTPRSRRSRS